jgi:LacI family transcriptional regulator
MRCAGLFLASQRLETATRMHRGKRVSAVIRNPEFELGKSGLVSLTLPAKKRRLTVASATIRDVAKRAGVSIKTVSRVVNNEPNVRADKATRVRQAVTELDYHPNYSARNLVRRHASLIALIYNNDASNNYIAALQDGALNVCQQFRYSFLLQPARHNSPGLVGELLSLVRQRRPSGLVITPPLCDVAALLDALDEQNTEYSLISPVDTKRNVPKIRVDERRASHEVTRYLLSLGHRRIGFVAGDPAHGAARLRFDGYVSALQEYDIAIDEKLIAQGMFSFESGLESGRTLLSQERRPTAIYAANDESAAGVLHAAHDLQLRIPEQLSVAGFDDAPLSRYVWPSLTTVRQPIMAMAESAVRVLINSAQQGGQSKQAKVDKSQDILMPHELLVRQSTAPPPRS